VRIGYIWLGSIETSVGLLWARQCFLGFHTRCRISWLAELLLTFQEGLFSMGDARRGRRCGHPILQSIRGAMPRDKGSVIVGVRYCNISVDCSWVYSPLSHGNNSSSHRQKRTANSTTPLHPSQQW
jgi:hypothetical protein